jgi:hypothetical protein
MATCDVCGNDYDKSFTVSRGGKVSLRGRPPCWRTPLTPSHTPSRTTRRKDDGRAGRDHHGA